MYGDYTYVNGKKEEVQDDIEAAKIQVAESLKAGLVKMGLNPEEFYYEDVVRQQYHNGKLDVELQYFDEPIFENSVPFVSVGVKAMRRK